METNVVSNGAELTEATDWIDSIFVPSFICTIRPCQHRSRVQTINDILNDSSHEDVKSAILPSSTLSDILRCLDQNPVPGLSMRSAVYRFIKESEELWNVANAHG
jgi:hypothetical protein